jgi:hypothetical protein
MVKKLTWDFSNDKIYFLTYFCIKKPNKHCYNINKSISQLKTLLKLLKNIKSN